MGAMTGTVLFAGQRRAHGLRCPRRPQCNPVSMQQGCPRTALDVNSPNLHKAADALDQSGPPPHRLSLPETEALSRSRRSAVAFVPGSEERGWNEERVAPQLVVGLVPIEPGSLAHLRFGQHFARRYLPRFDTHEFGRSVPLFAVQSCGGYFLLSLRKASRSHNMSGCHVLDHR